VLKNNTIYGICWLNMKLIGIFFSHCRILKQPNGLFSGMKHFFRPQVNPCCSRKRFLMNKNIVCDKNEYLFGHKTRVFCIFASLLSQSFNKSQIAQEAGNNQQSIFRILPSPFRNQPSRFPVLQFAISHPTPHIFFNSKVSFKRKD